MKFQVRSCGEGRENWSGVLHEIALFREAKRGVRGLRRRILHPGVGTNPNNYNSIATDAIKGLFYLRAPHHAPAKESDVKLNLPSSNL